MKRSWEITHLYTVNFLEIQWWFDSVSIIMRSYLQTFTGQLFSFGRWQANLLLLEQCCQTRSWWLYFQLCIKKNQLSESFFFVHTSFVGLNDSTNISSEVQAFQFLLVGRPGNYCGNITGMLIYIWIRHSISKRKSIKGNF